MTRPTPDHGTTARYKGTRTRPGCRCPRCRHAWNKANQQRAIRRAAAGPLVVDTPPIAAHIRALIKAGMTHGQVARAAGVHESTVLHIAAARSPKTHRRNAEKILAVPVGQPATVGPVPALGSMRRVRALYAIGHGPLAIAAVTGLTPENIRKIAVGEHQTVYATTRDAVTAAYRRLAMVPGTSVRARRRAEQEGWASPLAWDDIDDPKARPCRTARGMDGNPVDHAAVMRALEGEPIDLSPQERTAAIELGMRRGWTMPDLAAELGMDLEAVRRSWERIKARRRAEVAEAGDAAGEVA